jgi:hypothetical protein
MNSRRRSRWHGAALAVLTPVALGAALASAPRPAAAAPAAQTAPADKDACKDGGWAQFAALAFTNQGDCVSYVNARGLGEAAGVPGIDPAATPELGSLALFGSGAVGIAGYAALRRRYPRRG